MKLLYCLLQSSERSIFKHSKVAWLVDINRLRDEAKSKKLTSKQWANFIHSSFTAHA
jgi:hypothetical protein